MGLFVLADLHLSLGSDKPMDIFRNWEGYVDKLYENWNNLVGDDDTVVVPGDISWAMSLDNAKKDFDFINRQLKGKKIMLKGNHDYWWTTYRKMNEFLEKNKFDNIKILHNNAFTVDDITIVGTRGWINETEAEFDLKLLNREAARLEMSIKEGLKTCKEMIAFLHYPPLYNNDENYFIIEVLQKYNIKKCYYGHIHGSACKNAFIGYNDGINYQLVSADFLNFTPISVKI